MKTIAVFSMKGGTGRTTVACNLGAQLRTMDRRCVLADADPQNALGLHLGMQVGERFGLAREGISRTDVMAYAQRVSSPVPHVPFGQCNVDEIREFERRCLEDATLVPNRIVDLTPHDTELVVVDTAAGVGAWTLSVLGVADLVVVVLDPDAVSYATIPATQAVLSKGNVPGVVLYVINQMDSRRPLCNDVKASMESALGEYLFPHVIPYDEMLREAFANQTSLLDHTPDSLAVRGFGELGKWVVDILL